MTGRIRTVKPEWLEDELLAGASDEARVLSIGMILMADDHGRDRASIATIASTVWRYQLERDDGAHAPEVLARVSRALRELVDMRFVRLYEVSGQRYFEIRNWEKHQRVDRKGKPRVPPPILAESAHSRDSREPLASPSREAPETLATDLRSPTTTTTTTTTTIANARARASDGESAILSGFRSRWTSHRDLNGQPLGDLWPGPGKHDPAKWAAWAAEDPLRLAASLDGFFAIRDPFLVRSRWAFGAWSADPQRYVSARVDPVMGGGESHESLVARIKTTRYPS